ncbi:uncharacterized protein [Acropora muricata]|uniref:uncharacterized protein isoform X2 n=1 Tax=Acropora muricata TaxID=159855 RepID=UPI0034E41E9C
MVCYWLYAVIVCLKVTAFLHVSLVDAKVHPKGMEFKSLKFCAVNIFDIIAATELSKLPGGQILFKSRRDVCNNPDDRCTMLAGETYVFRGSTVLHDFLPGLSMTARGIAKAYNEDLYEFLCVEAVALKS